MSGLQATKESLQTSLMHHIGGVRSQLNFSIGPDQLTLYGKK